MSRRLTRTSATSVIHNSDYIPVLSEVSHLHRRKIKLLYSIIKSSAISVSSVAESACKDGCAMVDLRFSLVSSNVI